MNTPQHLANLMLLPWPQLQTYQQVVRDLVHLRARLEGPPTPAVPDAVPGQPEVPPPAAPTELAAPRPEGALASLTHRKPMRPPAPGSLRACVHDALRRAGRPVRRSEIIKTVALERGASADGILKGKVSDVLSSRHDHFIRRVSPGIYELASTDRGDLQCL